MKHFALILLLILSLLISGCFSRKNPQRSSFTVKSIISGNEIMLMNGYIVKLLGVENNASTKKKLNAWLTKEKVKFRFDTKSPLKKINRRSKDKSFYAYVLHKQECINSKLIKEKTSPVVITPYLTDSLNKYLSYNTQKKNKNPNPNFNTNKIGRTRCHSELDKLFPACDYTNSTTRNYAVNLAAKSPGSYNIAQVCNIFKEILPKWKYVNDPKGSEFYALASSTISETDLSGDCDDFAVLLYSLITSIGGTARINLERIWSTCIHRS